MAGWAPLERRVVGPLDRSEVVGFSAPPSGQGVRAFLWKSPGPAQTIGSLGGYSSLAFDINDLGQVVGWSHTATNATAVPKHNALIVWRIISPPCDVVVRVYRRERAQLACPPRHLPVLGRISGSVSQP